MALEDKEMDVKRQQLANYIYQELQKGNYSSSMSLYEAVSNELNNISDKGVKIMLRQKEQETQH
ncbi:hypothetical protein R4Z09_16545 [Niallia oryzisoli]|uniref:Uncharacterized protein n=1 Tax=Niallia oryzisoli TaxID=1737571 RepID=A0ABZ2C640_9BACI